MIHDESRLPTTKTHKEHMQPLKYRSTVPVPPLTYMSINHVSDEVNYYFGSQISAESFKTKPAAVAKRGQV